MVEVPAAWAVEALGVGGGMMGAAGMVAAAAEGVAEVVEVAVTGEGQKTSSVLSRALSRTEKRFRQRQVRLV